MKKKSTQFDKFTKRKSNAAIKEQFKQEKRKIKKEREEYFDRKKAEVRGQRPDTGSYRSKGHASPKESFRADLKPQTPILRPQTSDLIPLNKFIAHAGVCGRREAAEMVKKGLVKVNNVLITE